MNICYKCRTPIEEGSFSGLHVACFCDWFSIDAPHDFQDVVARSTEATKSDWGRITSSFFHGKFRKYSARLGNNSYLLKVQQAELPELPAMEYLCNQIAHYLDLTVPNHFFIKFQNELDTFVCENFMQRHRGCDLVHIYRFLDDPKKFTCEGLLNVLEREVKRFDDIDRLVKLCLFDALIGNHDRHGRNIGLIQSAGELRLAPFYDNPSYLALEDPLLLGALHEPRGAIGTKVTQEPTMSDYVIEWRRLGWDEAIQQFRKRVNLIQIEKLVRTSFISLKRQDAFLKLVKRRYQELCDASQ